MTRGLVWTVPVVAVAATAPSFASSGSAPSFTLVGQCKSPGNSCDVFPKGYEFRFEVCNFGSQSIWIYSVSYAVTGTNLTLTHATPTLPFELPANGCRYVVFRADSSTSANQTFTGTMTVTWGHESQPGVDPDAHPPLLVPIVVTSTPPDCECLATPNP